MCFLLVLDEPDVIDVLYYPDFSDVISNTSIELIYEYCKRKVHFG